MPQGSLKGLRIAVGGRAQKSSGVPIYPHVATGNLNTTHPGAVSTSLPTTNWRCHAFLPWLKPGVSSVKEIYEIAGGLGTVLNVKRNQEHQSA
jgi:hypothetical protein